MWTCSNCQNKFDDDTILFCPDCGTKKIKEAEVETELCPKCNLPMELVMMCPNCDEKIGAIIESNDDSINKVGIETDTQLCPNCKAPLELIWACFCDEKADKVKKELCPKCKKPLDPDEIFCGSCGAMRKEKKKVRNIILDHANTDAPESLPKVVTPVNPPAFYTQAEVQILDYSAFASQFPTWDLQPPNILIRRVKRSI